MRSRWHDRDIVEAAARHALSVHERSDSAPLTPYGIASCAASIALVLTAHDHENHERSIAQHLPPALVENGVPIDVYCEECGSRVEHRSGAWMCPTHRDRATVRFEPRPAKSDGR